MKFVSSVTLSLCALLAGATLGSASANPSTRVFGPRVTRAASSPPLRRLPFARRRAYVSGCYSNYSDSSAIFVGIGNAYNVAGGDDSAVLGGGENEACDGDDGIGAGYDNTIPLGAQSDFLGAGIQNVVGGSEAFVGAGIFGLAGGDGSFVGGGGTAYNDDGNNLSASQGNGNVSDGIDSFVGAGDLNHVTGNGSFIGAGGYAYADSGAAAVNQISGVDSFLGAGDRNTVRGNESFLGDGDVNDVAASQAAIVGGYMNAVGVGGSFSAIVGGNSNVATGEYEAIGGGYANVTKGADAVIPGGQRNEAYGELSFAAGYQAHALSTGSFVWSDYRSGSSPLADTGADQFVVRASGGTYVYSNEADTSGVKLAAGSGTWSSLSDRNAKTDIVPLDDGSVLAKVATLPLSTWRYKSEAGIKHVGPMAQDFYAAFGVGEDDRHITSIDEDGIALAAIKALDAKLERAQRDGSRKDSEIHALSRRVARLDAEVSGLMERR